VDARGRCVGQGVARRADEGVARILAGTDVDDPHVRGHTGDTHTVLGRGDGAGHMGPVATVVDVSGIDTTVVLARPVDLGDVGDEVARELVVEVRRDVRVAGVDARVDAADLDPLVTRLDLVRPLRVDHVHAPELLVQGIRLVLAVPVTMTLAMTMPVALAVTMTMPVALAVTLP